MQPQGFVLHQNHPNPFRPTARLDKTTIIQCELSESGFIQLTIYDILGRRVATLAQGWQPAGLYRVLWHGKSSIEGQVRVTSGIFFYELRMGNRVQQKKLVVMR